MRIKIEPIVIIFLAVLFLSACEPDARNKLAPANPHNSFSSESSVSQSKADESKQAFVNGKTELGYSSIGWDDLIPEDELEILMNPPEYLSDIVEGSDADRMGESGGVSGALPSDDKYQQALQSVNVRGEIDGKAVRVPGFVVPLEFDDDQVITQFFLVPYFGACIHMPPPPPNQIILVNYSTGLELDALYDPIWISGMLKVSLTENSLGRSAYSMDMHMYEPYI